MDKDYILNYMPDYYNGVYEMEELLKAQGFALSEFDAEQERVLLNQYIIKADEKGIAVFEDEAGIKPDPNDDLETRRNRVLLRLLPPKPLTVKYLNHLLSLMNLKATVAVDHPKRLAVVEAKSLDIDAQKIKSIKYMMNLCLPANMIYQIKVALSRVDINNEMYLGFAQTSDTFIKIPANTGQLNFRNDLITDVYIGIGYNTIVESSIGYNIEQKKGVIK